MATGCGGVTEPGAETPPEAVERTEAQELTGAGPALQGVTTANDATTFNAGCTDGKVFDAGLCYPRCDAGYKGVGPVCWQHCAEGYTDDGAFCRKDAHIFAKSTYGRGAGTPLQCGAGMQYDAGLCYPTCAAGYYGVGPVCWQSCPAGYTDDGAFCRRDARIIGANTSSCPWYDACGLTFARGCSQCPAGYANDGCTCRIDAHIFAKATYGRSLGQVPNTCPGGTHQDGALCYPYCASGYYGVGPVCWQSCPAGYTDDGAFCRKDAQIYAKATYGRGAGVVPTTCTSSSFTRSATGAGPWGTFTMIVASDPQFPWRGSSCSPNESETSCSLRENRHQVDAMNNIQQAQGPSSQIGAWPSGPGLSRGAGAPIRRPEGVIVNGDLTAYWHDWQVDLFEEYFNNPKSLKFPLFPGLGNHDYANNVPEPGVDSGCWWLRDGAYTGYGLEGCSRNAVDFMKATVQCNKVPSFPASLVRDFDQKSLAYSWDMGGYHFVQLHNYPTYTRTKIGISSSIPWLKADLTRATAEGKKIVLNMHDYGEHMAVTDPEFLAAIAGQRVVALFAGHAHHLNGFNETVPNTNIPVFRSGSTDEHKFLLVEFADTHMNVAVIDSTAGAPRFLDTWDSSKLRTVVFPSP